MKLIILAATALLLTACAGSSLFSGDNPQKAVFDARGAYGVLLNGAASYSTLTRCEAPAAPVICSKQAVVDQMRKADIAAKATLDAAEDVVRNHPDMDAGTAVAAATNAVAAFTTIFDTYHIAKGN